MSLWEKEKDEIFKLALQDLFPRAIKFGLGFAHGWRLSESQAYSLYLPLSHLSSTHPSRVSLTVRDNSD